MKKSLGVIIDELSVTNIKIFMLIDKVHKNEHTKEDATKIQDLNLYRSQLINAINEEFGGEEIVKV